MAIDKRRKIVAEFKQPNDAAMLHEILEKMRTGEPISSEIQEVQDDTKQLGSSQ